MKKLPIINLVLLLTLGSILLYAHLNRPKTAYILIGEVFNNFTMKKDLEKKFNQTKTIRQKIADSLAVDLRILVKEIDNEKAKDKEKVDLYNRKREEFYRTQKNMQQDNEALTSQYDKEILTQMNQYVKDYGKENHYQYIFGNDNNGSLMYGDEAKDITKAIIEYINLKYKGIK